MPTDLEKRLAQAARDLEGGSELVPLLHGLLQRPLNIDTNEDAEFLKRLAQKQVKREETRLQEGVFSPSGLASCLRRVWLSKNYRELGLKRVELPAIEPHFYFFTGDFLHLKWQYALYKLSVVTDEWTLLDVEIPVLSKRKDHGGTIDVLGLLRGELIVVDIKGLNVRSWRKIADGELQHEYRIQVTDYAILFNSMVKHGLKPTKLMRELPELKDGYPKIKRAFVLAENKGGVDYRHPAALAEAIVIVKDSAPDVRARLDILREHQAAGTYPEIECTSTRTMQFTGCPFAEVCKNEVKSVERENAKKVDTKVYRLARPKPRRTKKK